ncbi:MAG: DUF1761 domain-containing protein [bacterium]|nr:DUF1761 domain-containing protein [bacterium]
MEVNINLWAVIVAAIASMAVGFVWYGVLFKKSWMQLMGITAESMKGVKMTANKAYLIQFIASLVMAYSFQRILYNLQGFPTVDISNGGIFGITFLIWLGFVAPITLGVVLWEGKSWKLWFINASNYLVALIVMGVILALWQ